MIAFIQATNGITVNINGTVRTLSAEDKYFEELADALKVQAGEDRIREILDRELIRMQAAVEALQETSVTADISISNGEVFYRGSPVHNSSTVQMLAQLKEGWDLRPMAAFLSNLMQNTSYRAVQDLYSFIAYGKMPITPDGYFLAYRRLRPNYKDWRTNSIDNTPGGAPISMPRNMVDDNPEKTCSPGYHVCSFEYLQSFHRDEGPIVVCKVNPRDVVAIPTDYNHTKMRVCTYQVLSTYEEADKGCQLSRVAVSGVKDPFVLRVEGRAPSSQPFTVLEDAVRAAEEFLKRDSTQRVIVTNRSTGTVVFERENGQFALTPRAPVAAPASDGGAAGSSFDVLMYSSPSLLEADLGVIVSSGVLSGDLERHLEDLRAKWNPYALRLRNVATGVTEQPMVFDSKPKD